MKLKGRMALVTGASSGIGAEIAFSLAQAGAQVALTARRKELLKKQADRIQSAGGKVDWETMDVSSESSVQKSLSRLRNRMGAFSIVVNNAGIGYKGTIEATDTEEFEKTFAVNMKGLYWVTKYCLGDLKETSGDLVNVSSIAGKEGFSELSLYCASKHAVQGFSKALLEEVRGAGVRVTMICPGMVDTDFFPKNVPYDRTRMISPVAVAQAILAAVSAHPSVTWTELSLRPRRPVMKEK